MIVNTSAIYRELAENRYWDLWFEIEFAYSVAEFDLVRERIAEFELDPLGASRVPGLLNIFTIECECLRNKYRWERQYWGRSQMALVP